MVAPLLSVVPESLARFRRGVIPLVPRLPKSTHSRADARGLRTARTPIYPACTFEQLIDHTAIPAPTVREGLDFWIRHGLVVES